MHDSYMWIKALHIIAVISWMAGMLYLPRLFVYHANATPGSDTARLLEVMEYRLLKYIINPAMIATFLLGFYLANRLNAFDPANGLWMHVKFALVLLLSALHGFFARCRRRFSQGANVYSPRTYKIINESVTLLMIAIVILVVVKPF